MLRSFIAFTAFVAIIPAAALSQKCTEQTIKEPPSGHAQAIAAPDVYFSNASLKKLIVGAQVWKSQSDNEKKTTTRKNMKGSCKTDRLVVAPSGEMAYAYGTCDSTFDDEADGKHHEVITSFLDVWRVVDGTCKLAARSVHIQRGEEERNLP